MLAALRQAGLTTAEVYRKQGRSRRVELNGEEILAASSQEAGWAVRAGDRHASFFFAGTGDALPLGGWPAPDGMPLELPVPQPAASWSPPADLDAPLLGETEGLALLQAMAGALAKELPGARLSRAALDDGSSVSELQSSQGIVAGWRNRAAALYLEAVLDGRAGGRRTVGTSLYLAEREARRFSPLALARRLADRLALATGPTVAVDRGATQVVVDPAVGVRLLAGLAPLLVGGQAEERRRHFLAAGERLAAPALSILDDGRLEGGLLAAAVDGEGTATRRAVLVDAGLARDPLLSWREARDLARGARASGCVRRAGWRDIPLAGPTHLFVRPAEEVPVAALLAEVEEGYYLLDATGPGQFDFAADRFSLPACGFALSRGRASGPLPDATLHGAISRLLQGVVATARDLSFFPLGGMLGSPTLLLRDVGISS